MLNKSIGSLNGPWSILLRLALSTYPLLLAWGVWVTVNQFEDRAFRLAGDRFTQSDGLRLQAEIYDRMSRLPPQDWRDRIIAIEKNQQDILAKLARIETLVTRAP